MTYRTDVARGRAIIERWSVLAEQRLDYLTELFETGRWRRFHTEVDFLENVQEAKKAVETWRMLLNQEGAADNSAVDTSWLESKPLPPRKPSILHEEIPRVLPRSLRLVAQAPEAPSQEPSLETAEMVSAADANAWQQGLDLSVIQQRYPLLRNAL